jgi:tetratricopeptide (TPR) repeat protein
VRLVLDVNELRGRLHRLGRHDQALRLALQGHALAAIAVAGGGRRADRGMEGTSLAFLADSYAATGDVENALNTADAAIALIRDDAISKSALSAALRLRARLLRHLGRTTEADQAVREATDLDPS